MRESSFRNEVAQILHENVPTLYLKKLTWCAFAYAMLGSSLILTELDI